MTMKMYQTPIVEIAKCAPFHALMEVSEPKPVTTGGSGMPAPERKVFY